MPGLSTGCEKEILSMLRVLADLLDVKMTAHCEPFSQEGGYRVVWPIAGESSRSISVVLNILMQVLTRPTLSVGGQPLVDGPIRMKRICRRKSRF